MRIAWLVVAACSSPATRPEEPPVIVPADAAVIDAAPVVLRSHQIAASDRYACALRDKIVCWGMTPIGDHATPAVVPIEGAVGIAAGRDEVYGWTADGVAWRYAGKRGSAFLTEVREIVASDLYACARHTDDRVTCWREHAIAEIAVRAKEVAVAVDSACARLESGAVMCWTPRERTPVEVPDARGAIGLAGGFHKLAAFKADGEIVEWEPATGRRVPAPKLPGIAKLAIDRMQSCAIGQRLVCWNEEVPASRHEVPIAAVDVAVGSTLACAQTIDQVACWGFDFRSTAKPIEVAGLTNVVQLSANGRHTCARRANGTVACWGERLTDSWSRYFKIADLRPVDVPDIADATDLVVAVRNACVRRKSGVVACWGLDDVPADTQMRVRPVDVPLLTQARALVVHGASVCGLRDGTVECRATTDGMFDPFSKSATRIWSGSYLRSSFLCAKVADGVECQEGFFGRHGDSPESQPSTLDTGLGDVVDLQLPDTEDRMCLVRASGVVECRGVYEQHEWTPNEIEDGVSLAFGANRDVCALRRSGKVSCWGKDDEIADVPGVRDAVELVGAGSHACARRKSGRVVCWGNMDLVGHGERADTDTPYFVTTSPSVQVQR